MGISAAETTTVDIRLTESVTTGAGGVGDRSGLLLRVETDDGLVGFGETAPIPGVDGPGLEAIAVDIDKWVSSAPGTDLDAALADLDTSNPLARFAIHTALIDLQSQRKGTSAATFLHSEALDSVRVNGLVTEANPAAVHSRTAELVASGMDAIKLKVGAGDPATDVTRIIAASEAGGPEVALRLDANRAWNQETAEKVLGRVGRHRIDFLEDPTYDVSTYMAIQENTGVAIALDMPITSTPAEMADEASVGTVVVKPAAVGGIDRILQLAQDRPDLRIVVSSSIDREIGLAAAVHCAAALANKDEAHGVATGVFVRNIPEALLPGNGRVGVPSSGIWRSDG